MFDKTGPCKGVKVKGMADHGNAWYDPATLVKSFLRGHVRLIYPISWHDKRLAGVLACSERVVQGLVMGCDEVLSAIQLASAVIRFLIESCA